MDHTIEIYITREELAERGEAQVRARTHEIAWLRIIRDAQPERQIRLTRIEREKDPPEMPLAAWRCRYTFGVDGEPAEELALAEARGREQAGGEIHLTQAAQVAIDARRLISMHNFDGSITYRIDKP